MKIIYRLFLLLITNSCFSQEYSDMWEMYKSSQDFVNKKTFYVAEFSIEQTSDNPIFYKIKSSDSEAERLSKEPAIWAIYKDSTLFLNAKRMGMRNSYVKVRELGKYCHFMGDYVFSLSEEDKIKRTYGNGLIGAMAQEIIKDDKGNIPYIMKLDVGVPHILDKNYLEFILRDYYDLIEQFLKETNADSLETQLKYIRLLNKR